MDGGWMDQEAIDQERFDADREQAQLEAEGRSYAKRSRRAAQLRAAGRLVEASAMCPHGGGYPLDSLAARNAKDPRAGQPGIRCYDCGSVLSDWGSQGVVLFSCETWSTDVDPSRVPDHPDVDRDPDQVPDQAEADGRPLTPAEPPREPVPATLCRKVDWGHWSLDFIVDGRVYARLFFPVGPQGPADGTLGSPERQRYLEYCDAWIQRGVWPLAASVVTPEPAGRDAQPYPGEFDPGEADRIADASMPPVGLAQALRAMVACFDPNQEAEDVEAFWTDWADCQACDCIDPAHPHSAAAVRAFIVEQARTALAAAEIPSKVAEPAHEKLANALTVLNARIKIDSLDRELVDDLAEVRRLINEASLLLGGK